ncbi:Xaa-Pro dipeptidase [Pragia fontium]|uniref:Xaa-Pro dipeptidase n=1 Tax=Pragia fontium TaxID=82985 RepID=UPI000F6BD970|nr:Xaa-Pro dipeptidase [Pragia fontium]VEJ57015.1 Xaa-Pro dipeptidase [Pragia fontium]
MEKLAALYQAHISVLQQRTRDVLQRNQLDALLIHSGELNQLFLDDRHYPFKVNPHFKAWVPVTEVQNCWIWVDGVNKPKLWFYSPVDYWYSVEPIPDGFWTSAINIQPLKNADNIVDYLPATLDKVGYIGPNPARAEWLGMTAKNINPKAVIDYLHYYRSYKTDYELACMREAQKVAINGHKAARDAFYSDMSEFDINLAYLTATGHRDTNVPYDNIIALNEHAAVLHYTKLEPRTPDESHSFLIDAGAEYNGYAADLTRTYARYKDSDFGLMIQDLNSEQLALIATLKSGVNFVEYHLQMHQRIAKLLKKYNLIVDMSEDDIVETGISNTFFPHGLGHPLGLQVHDVAGFMQDNTGTQVKAPERYPALRCTRALEPGMVMTIEPGLYFIDSLLEPWRDSQFKNNFNWMRINKFRPYGGIRIEDNVVIRKDRVENMTRDLKLS